MRDSVQLQLQGAHICVREPGERLSCLLSRFYGFRSQGSLIQEVYTVDCTLFKVVFSLCRTSSIQYTLRYGGGPGRVDTQSRDHLLLSV